MRPLRVKELAELSAIQPNADTIPTFDACLRPENPEEFVLSACSTLVAVVNVGGEKIVQFSHFSVREYLISHRIAISEHVSRFHILPRPAHALFARACLGVLLQLGDRVDRYNIRNSPLALYAAEYWVDHAQFENVSSDIQHGMECFFDKNKPHSEAWLWLYNIDDSSSIYMITYPSLRPYAVPLYYAALCGFHDITEHLIDAHPQDVNARGGTRMTSLHAALDKGHLDVAMLLVEHGADMESRDFQNQTPLHIAAHRGYAEAVSLLIDCGADLDAEKDNQATPLYVATKEGRQDIARLLLEHGADANHRNNCGRTPLHLASLKGHDEIVRPLFDHDADSNHPDKRGLIPLHLASLHGYNDTARLLLDHGADANHPDKYGYTPLHVASVEGHNDIVQLLLDHGASMDHRDMYGFVPLYHALQEHHTDTVRLLVRHLFGRVLNHPDNGS